MKKVTKKLVSAVLTLVMALSIIVAVPAKETKAAYDYNYQFRASTYTFYYAGTSDLNFASVSIMYGSSLKKSDVKNLKSSNSNVKLYLRAGGKITFKVPSKALTTTITCTVNGRALSTTVKIRPAGNPFKTFNIGSKKLAAGFKNKDYQYTMLPIVKSKGKTTIATNSGWKIVSYYYYNSGSTSISKTNLTASKVSKSFAFTGSISYLEVRVHHEKSDLYRTVQFKYID